MARQARRPSVILPLLVAYALAGIGVEFAIVFANAMMPTLVPPDRLGRLSGTGWAAGYLGGMVSLMLVLGFLAANPDTGRTLIGLMPLFGLDPFTHQGDRISGPLTRSGSSCSCCRCSCSRRTIKRNSPCARRSAGTEQLANPRRIAEAKIVDDVPPRQHDLCRRPGLAVCFRRHLCRRYVWLEYDPDRDIRNSAGHDRTLGAWIGGRLDDWFGPKRVISGGLMS